MFTVVIPLYNKESNIRKTIDSVLCQSYTNFQLVVINDGSTDNSLKIVSQYEDPRLDVYTIKNSGVSAARNYGISKAKFPYIALLDGDDYWDINYLEVAKQAIYENSNVQLFSSAYSIVKNGRIEKLDFGLNNASRFNLIEDYFELMLRSSFSTITASSVIISKYLLDEVKGFNEKLKYGEDLDLWFRLLMRTNYIFINEVMVYYNFDGQERACDKVFDFETDIIFHLDAFKNLELKSQSAKRYFNLFRLQKLKTYHLNGQYIQYVKKCLSEIDENDFGIIWKVFYYSPRVIIKPLYKCFFYFKHNF